MAPKGKTKGKENFLKSFLPLLNLLILFKCGEHRKHVALQSIAAPVMAITKLQGVPAF